MTLGSALPSTSGLERQTASQPTRFGKNSWETSDDSDEENEGSENDDAGKRSDAHRARS